ncbi:ABC transporter substrate-binding protein [Paenarthrobacter sp. NPDC090522]|uniref:ABC transporter substrate-binding protein n=1 Tax=Paenarthrobacter sp. NPDC090522 TaxID=3364383 RepID=UPI003802E202
MNAKLRCASALLVSGMALAAVGCSQSAPATQNNPSTTSGAVQGLGSGVAQILDGVQPSTDLVSKVPENYKSGIKVGSDLTAPPGTYLADDRKTPVGFEVDLINAIAKKLGTTATVSNADFSTLITSVSTNRIDLVISQMNDNSTRQKQIDFIDYYDAGIAFIVQHNNPGNIQGPQDLCGKKVSAGPGSSQLAWAQRTSPEICPSDKPMNITIVEENQQRLNSLKTGRLDVVLNDTPGAAFIAATSGGGNDFESVKLKEAIEPAPYGMGFNKSNSELRDAVKAALQELIDDGTYKKILTAWGVENGARAQATLNGGK